jgi:hypothetical protein
MSRTDAQNGLDMVFKYIYMKIVLDCDWLISVQLISILKQQCKNLQQTDLNKTSKTYQENVVSTWTVRYKCKLKLQLSRTFLCVLLIPNRMVSCKIWIKQAFVSFSKTSNSTRPSPSDSRYFDALWKINSCMFYPNCIRNQPITYTNIGS